ncbi:hypothetical protein CRUP_031353 [Coryphaenoides rupestris]|nr:hypothetical protein CRUP_031353 [Coryphaenoides rupestris]
MEVRLGAVLKDTEQRRGPLGQAPLEGLYLVKKTQGLVPTLGKTNKDYVNAIQSIVDVAELAAKRITDEKTAEDEADDPPQQQAGRGGPLSPGSSSSSYDTSEPPPRGAPKKRKRSKKEKEGETERGRGERGRGGRGKKAGHAPRQSSRDCRVEKREMKVRDLGLGFDSDEIVLFKFCVGSCQSLRTNYDLALKALLQNGSLPRHTARRVSSQPCCRPDRYEPVSFMDAQTTWRTIQSLSAASCMCMG